MGQALRYEYSGTRSWSTADSEHYLDNIASGSIDVSEKKNLGKF